MTQAAAAADTKNGSEPKPRTKQLPGMEDKHDPEISKRALKLREIRTQRMELQRQEAEAQEALIECMREKKTRIYRDLDNEFVVERTNKEKATVKKLVHDEDGKAKAEE